MDNLYLASRCSRYRDINWVFFDKIKNPFRCPSCNGRVSPRYRGCHFDRLLSKEELQFVFLFLFYLFASLGIDTRHYHVESFTYLSQTLLVTKICHYIPEPRNKLVLEIYIYIGVPSRTICNSPGSVLRHSLSQSCRDTNVCPWLFDPLGYGSEWLQPI